MRTNASIKAHYEEGHDYTSDGSEEEDAILNYLPRMMWATGMIEPTFTTLLEIGCGDGSLSNVISSRGFNVLGVDYVDSDSWRTGWGLRFEVRDYRDVEGVYDFVVMKGVLEHMDDPLETLEFIAENFKPDQIITSSPSFLNPRGYIWMALQLLFDYPMSLADLHFILPSQMEEWAEKIGFSCEYVSVDQDWGHGQRLIDDFNKRLPNVFRDIEADVPTFMAWLEKTLPYQSFTEHSGATIVYNLRRK